VNVPQSLLPRRCKSCAYYLQTGSDVGECHRHAPAPSHDRQEVMFTYWPEVEELDFCGEWVRDGNKPEGASNVRDRNT